MPNRIRLKSVPGALGAAGSFISLLMTILALFALSIPSKAMAAEYFLRAASTQVMMPGGEMVTMWGFARDSSFGARDGVVTVPYNRSLLVGGT